MMNNLKTDLSKYDNSWYQPGGFLKRFIWHYVNSFIFNNNFFPFSFLKIFFLQLFGAKIGQGVVIKTSISIKYPWFLEIGNYTWIGENVWIDNLGKVKIGNHVCISQGALLLSGSHNYAKTSFDLLIKDIVLEDGVWIGAKSIVCQGVTCKSHSVLSSNSVALKDLEPYSIYRGNPAEKIKDRVIE